VWLKIYGSKGDLVSIDLRAALDGGEKAIEFMILTPKLPMVGAN
jgi:hypothetical protein